MIIEGESITGVTLENDYLKADKNERATVCEISGVMAMDVNEALEEMRAVALGTRCQKPLYHAQINPEPGEAMTPERWARSVDLLEEKLGLVGHPRLIVEHSYKDRVHRHVVWSRINPETMTARHMSHHDVVHEKVGLMLEMEFGHKITARSLLSPSQARKIIGEYVPPDQVEAFMPPKPDKTKPADYEFKVAQRTGLDLHQFRAQVRAIKEAADSPQAFMSGLKAAGVTLCQGRRGFVLVDSGGGEHELGRTLGMKIEDARAYMKGIDRTALPTPATARAVLKARAAAAGKPMPAASKHGQKRREAKQPKVRMPAEKRAQAIKANALRRSAIATTMKARNASVKAVRIAPPPSFIGINSKKFDQEAAKQARMARLAARRIERAAEAEQAKAKAEAEAAMRRAGRKAPIAAMSEEERKAIEAAQDAARHVRIDGTVLYNDKGQAIGHLELQADGSVKVIKRGSRFNPPTLG